MKRLITILITTVITLNIWGAKAYPLPLTITQKDGKTLTYQLHGDENFNYAATTDGVLLYQTDNDFFIAVINEKGEMESSGVLAHNAGQRTAEEIALIGKQDKDKYFAAEKASVAKSRGMKRIGIPENTLQPFFPHLGSPRALVILADFKDQKFKHDDDSTIAIFDQYLNSMEPFNPEKELEVDWRGIWYHNSCFLYSDNNKVGLVAITIGVGWFVDYDSDCVIYFLFPKISVSK